MPPLSCAGRQKLRGNMCLEQRIRQKLEAVYAKAGFDTMAKEIRFKEWQ